MTPDKKKASMFTRISDTNLLLTITIVIFLAMYIGAVVIQGGGFTEDFRQKHADSIKGEFEANGVKNDLKHTRGVLSMARTNVPDSASSQFFVMHRDAPHLDRQYAAFGKLTDGFDVLDDIAATRTGTRGFYMQDVPVRNVVIETIKLSEE